MVREPCGDFLGLFELRWLALAVSSCIWHLTFVLCIDYQLTPDERHLLATIGSLLKLHRAKQPTISSLFPAALLVCWIALTLLTVNARDGMLIAQTETPNKAKPQSTDPPLPDGPGKDLVMRACVKCHNLKIITTKRPSEEEWTRSVDNMVNRGAVLSDDEADEVIDYLSHNFKPAESDQKQQPDNAPQK